MTSYQGTCQKMTIGLDGSAHAHTTTVLELQHLLTSKEHSSNLLHFDVNYALELNTNSIHLSKQLNQPITIEWQQQITCKKCLQTTKKSYGQGYCYLCFKRSAACDICMMQPHTCHYHLGTCREPSWASSVCFNDHIVYLTYTSDIKVGITRTSQVPTRWLDQGAIMALPIIKTSSRRMAGIIENCISQHFADKTNWRTMLKTAFITPKLSEIAEKIDSSVHYIKTQLTPDINNQINQHPMFAGSDVTDTYEWLNHFPKLAFHYPVDESALLPPTTKLTNIKIKSHNLEKHPKMAGKLLAIKGQYLIFDTGVINMRKYTSYGITIHL